jgi:hypothetical protein
MSTLTLVSKLNSFWQGMGKLKQMFSLEEEGKSHDEEERNTWKSLRDLVWKEVQVPQRAFRGGWAGLPSALPPPAMLAWLRRGLTMSSAFTGKGRGLWGSLNIGNMASIVLENSHLFVLSPWNLERMSWILCSHQAYDWLCPENLTPGGKERGLLSGAGSWPPCSRHSADSLKPLLPDFMSRVWVKFPHEVTGQSCNSGPRVFRIVY